jgi:hypothetical protein
MKVHTFLAVAAASIGMAAPASADPGDDAFLAALTQAGITYQSPDKAITAGQKVCDLASSGTSQLDIVRDIRDLNPAFTMAKAAKFAKAAANAYCPALLDPSDSAGGGGGG